MEIQTATLEVVRYDEARYVETQRNLFVISTEVKFTALQVASCIDAIFAEEFLDEVRNLLRTKYGRNTPPVRVRISDAEDEINENHPFYKLALGLTEKVAIAFIQANGDEIVRAECEHLRRINAGRGLEINPKEFASADWQPADGGLVSMITTLTQEYLEAKASEYILV